MWNVVEETIQEAYGHLIELILEEGEQVKDERGSLTHEVLNIQTTITNPLKEDYLNLNPPIYQIIKTPKGTFWTGERLEKYCKEFTSSDRQGFVYTYGNRYREWFNNIDQIQVAIDRLQNCKESRRAISVTWDPRTDTINDEVPCMILVDFKIRDDKLYTTALWRSHDIYGAWFANVVGLTYLAQYVAKELDVTVDAITVESISAHIYDTDLEAAKSIWEQFLWKEW